MDWITTIFCVHILTEDMRSQSLLNIAGTRRSMVDLPSSQPPPPYQVRPSSQDDMNLVRGTVPRSCPRFPVSSAPYLDSVLRREQARYESIRERTEPESSSSDNEVPQRRPRPPPRGIRTRPRPLSEELSLDPRDANALTPLTSSQGANSREGTPVSVEGGEGQSMEMQRSETITNGSLQVDRSFSSHRSKASSSGPMFANGDVKMRKRAKRERLKMYRQGQ